MNKKEYLSKREDYLYFHMNSILYNFFVVHKFLIASVETKFEYIKTNYNHLEGAINCTCILSVFVIVVNITLTFLFFNFCLDSLLKQGVIQSINGAKVSLNN